MRTKNITLNCTYEITSKNNIEFNEACKKLKYTLECIFDSDEFLTHMCSITQEGTIDIENIADPKVELFVTLFITTIKPPQLPSVLFRQFLEQNLINIDTENFNAKLIKRKIHA